MLPRARSRVSARRREDVPERGTSYLRQAGRRQAPGRGFRGRRRRRRCRADGLPAAQQRADVSRSVHENTESERAFHSQVSFSSATTPALNCSNCCKEAKKDPDAGSGPERSIRQRSCETSRASYEMTAPVRSAFIRTGSRTGSFFAAVTREDSRQLRRALRSSRSRAGAGGPVSLSR